MIAIRIARALASGLMALLLGCAANPGPTVAPSALAETADYQSGLADSLASIPADATDYTVRWVRWAYDLGYKTGAYEKSLVAEKERLLLVAIGCTSALTQIKPRTEAEAARGADICRERMEAAEKEPGKFRGKEYAAGRLLIAERTVGDQRAARLFDGSYKRGYALAFSAGDSTDVLSALRDGCLLVARGRLVGRAAMTACFDLALSEQRQLRRARSHGFRPVNTR